MEVDFDKEIDTLLRKAHGDGPVLVGDFASSGHLDADQISAFAENAMPENSRALYSAHLAECTRCRKILSNLLMMNAEEAPVAASPLSAITIAERSMPWYRKLFLFPNLAYVMGGLVLVFSGFLGYTVIQRSGSSGDATVSQIPESESSRGGPNAEVQHALSGADSANTAANVASSNSTAFLANANAATAPAGATEGRAAGPQAPENNFAMDGVDAAPADRVSSPRLAEPSAATGASGGLPAPKPVLREEREKDDLVKEKAEDKAATTSREIGKTDSAPMMKQAPASASQSQTQSGPMQNSQNQYNRQLENMDARARAADKKKSSAREEETSVGRKVIGGKTFERKQSVWYDTTYSGHPTINVRRGTSEFDKLPGGLRSIANSLSGVAVIVWGAKAYRIQ